MTTFDGLRDEYPRLGRGVRLVHDPVRDAAALLYPEGVLLLNESAGAVLARCDGSRGRADITAALAEVYDGVTGEDVDAVIDEIEARRLLRFGPAAPPARRRASPSAKPPPGLPPELPPGLTTKPSAEPSAAPSAGVDGMADIGGAATPPPDPVPVGMVAELTYRCPLHCPYCSNPIGSGYRDELDTEGWVTALDQARRLGVLQVHLSGGEPMLRRDIVDLVGHAHRIGLYTNLITSGIPMDAGRLDALVDAGLDHVQLSIQDVIAGPADAIAGTTAHQRKLDVARLVTAAGLPLTINVVLHRHNVDRLFAIAELACGLGADRLELAHTQYYGWGLRNRAALLPTAEQVATAERDAERARKYFGDQIQLVYVLPDHHRARPKACMAGWGSRQFVVAPNGDVLPCLAAGQIPDLGAVNIQERPLAEIWYASDAFNRFRGTGWMREPCRSCPLRDEDLGGCRCQAFQLTGDPAATDPVCELSPQHHLVASVLDDAVLDDAVLDDAAPTALTPRRNG